MRRRKRTTTVTFETERVLISGGSISARCDLCGDCAPMVALNEAARLACMNELTLYRLVEARTLHHCETAGGQLLVCLNSLTQQARKQ